MDSKHIPLSHKLRPTSLNEFIGQEKLLKENGIIKQLINTKKPCSLLFYGPPGCGKTTLANILIKYIDIPFIEINGVSFSTTVFKKMINNNTYIPMYIIIDEIHRMNKAQQDALLPYIEKGDIFIIGTTTQNPSFEINTALLSRMNILIFEKLSKNNIKQIIKKACNYLKISPKETILDYIADYASYDARQAINIVETLNNSLENIDSLSSLMELLSKRYIPYDKSGENHYNLISAFHKSIRGSDVNAGLYYLARMLIGGEDPLYIVRRMIRIASEDIGNADINALQIALNTYRTFEILGSPEGELALAQCAIYLALAPKSVSTYNAFNKAMEHAKQTSSEEVPLKFRNAPTKFMKDIGYANNYKYPPKYKYSYVNEKYFPNNVNETTYYIPSKRGFEKELAKRIEFFKKLKQELSSSDN